MNRQERQDLYEATNAVCEGTVTPSQYARLDELLLRHQEARRHYLACGQVHSMLRASDGQVSPPSTQRTGPKKTLYLRAAIFLAAAAILVLALNLPFTESAIDYSASLRPGGSASWTPQPSGPGLNGTYHLSEGLSVLEFSSGVILSIHGPTMLNLAVDSPPHITSGKVAAYVPESGQGFQITTPQGTITDHGTEFGVEVSDSATTEVHVYDGEVEIQQDEDVNTRLFAGQAYKFGADGQQPELKQLRDLAFSHMRSELAGGALLGDFETQEDGKGWTIESKDARRLRPITMQKANPLTTDSGGYAAVAFDVTESRLSQPMVVVRHELATGSLVDLSLPYTFECLIRLDTPAAEVKQLAIYDSDRHRFTPRLDYTWRVIAQPLNDRGELTWRCYNSRHGGNDKRMHLRMHAGASYRVFVEVDPVRRKYRSVISDGTAFISNSLGRGGRSNFQADTHNGGVLHFIAIGKDGAMPQLSLDSVKVRNIPQPTMIKQ